MYVVYISIVPYEVNVVNMFLSSQIGPPDGNHSVDWTGPRRLARLDLAAGDAGQHELADLGDRPRLLLVAQQPEWAVEQ